MANYKFTKNWFVEKDQLGQILKGFKKEQELHFLEIGSYEGRSTVWFLERFFENENSTITCIDPFADFSQNKNSLASYGANKAEWSLSGIKKNFLHNVAATGKDGQVKVIQDLSGNALLTENVRSKEYDMIFIDGNHTARFVLEDAVMSWGLLKVGGIMVFDDYKWNLEKPETLRPKIAIDTFVKCYADYLKPVYNGYRFAVQKTK